MTFTISHDSLASDLALPPRRGLLAPLHDHPRAYLCMNAIYYGLILVMMAIMFATPDTQGFLLKQLHSGINQGPLAGVADAYRNGHLLRAIVLTFVINFFVGSILTFNIPSAIVPFIGIAFACIRAILWGVLFSPANLEPIGGRLPMLPHYLTLIIEGQGYVLAMFAAYLQGRWVLPTERPRGEVYFEGVINAIKVYRLIAIVLAIAAVYEALEVIYLVPHLKHV